MFTIFDFYLIGKYQQQLENYNEDLDNDYSFEQQQQQQKKRPIQ